MNKVSGLGRALFELQSIVAPGKVLEVPGPPMGKARPRVGRYGVYTPEKTVNYSVLIRELWIIEHGSQTPPIEGPVFFLLSAHFPIPKGASKKHRELMLAGKILPAKKPDFDNIEKMVADALNGLAYVDDKQICYSVFGKVYSDRPRVVIEVIPM